MDKGEMLLVIVVGLLIALLFSPLVLMAVEPIINPMPQCQEDVVIIGQGDFENGRWEYYVCGPAIDDY